MIDWASDVSVSCVSGMSGRLFDLSAGLTACRAVCLSLSVSVPLMNEQSNNVAEPLLLLVGQDAEVSRLAADYCLYAMPMLPGITYCCSISLALSFDCLSHTLHLYLYRCLDSDVHCHSVLSNRLDRVYSLPRLPVWLAADVGRQFHVYTTAEVFAGPGDSITHP